MVTVASVLAGGTNNKLEPLINYRRAESGNRFSPYFYYLRHLILLNDTDVIPKKEAI